MRLSKEHLDEIKNIYNVNRLWSWSKINTFITSPYEYYLKYIIKAKEDNDNCSYTTLGTICHDIIEQLYNEEIKYEDMLESFKQGWTTAIDIAQLKFDRNDENKNLSIGNKYKANLEHFFAHHNMLDGSVRKQTNIEHIDALNDLADFKCGQLGLERFIAIRIGEYVLQGYIDLVEKDNEGIYNITDWKTSTQYKGKKAEDEAGQLVIYAIGLNQMGIPWDKIHIRWNFLKYVTVRCEQANGKFKYRDIERCKIGQDLSANAKMWLNKLGYSEQVDYYLNLLVQTNSIDVLPEEVKNKYVMSDCYTYVPLTDKLVERWKDTVITTIRDILLREQDYEETKNDKLFWDDDESVKSESYYFATLCGYSPKLHLPYQAYLEKREMAENGLNMFTDLGSSNSSETNNVICENNDIDLSWLDNI